MNIKAPLQLNTLSGSPANPPAGTALVYVKSDGFVYIKSSAGTETKVGGTDLTAQVMGDLINGATAKTTPVDADMVGLADSQATNVLKKSTWANIKAALKTYFDTLYNNYVHPTTSGNKHIPTGGTSNQVLKYSADGTAQWGTDADTVYTHPATHSADMITDGTNNKAFTAAEKSKLGGVAEGANNYAHPDTSGNKHVPTGGAANQVLKYSADGTAQWGTDNDTVYTHPTTAGNIHVPTGGAAGQILGYGGASGTAQWQAAPSSGVGGTSTLNSTTGRSITHNLGNTNYHVDVTPTAATNGYVGEIYVTKAINTVTIYNTGTSTAAITYRITPY